jgi:hypothetical protein
MMTSPSAVELTTRSFFAAMFFVYNLRNPMQLENAIGITNYNTYTIRLIL